MVPISWLALNSGPFASQSQLKALNRILFVGEHAFSRRVDIYNMIIRTKPKDFRETIGQYPNEMCRDQIETKLNMETILYRARRHLSYQNDQ